MKYSTKNGLLISIEGIDGSGKSTFAQALFDALSQKHPSLLTKEPGGTILGKALRQLLLHTHGDKDPKTEFLLFAADRAQHFSEVVLPALAQNIIVISDRMADSSLVYQGYVKGLPLAMLQKINTWAMQNKSPDLTILIDIDEATAFNRLQTRNDTQDVFEQRKAEIPLRIAAFRDLFSKKEKNQILILNGTLPTTSLVETAITSLTTLLASIT